MTKKPTKAQLRAQAVAERQRASDAAAKQRRNRIVLWGGLAVVVVIAVVVALVAGGGGDSANATKYETAPVKVNGTPLPRVRLRRHSRSRGRRDHPDAAGEVGVRRQPGDHRSRQW